MAFNDRRLALGACQRASNSPEVAQPRLGGASWHRSNTPKFVASHLGNTSHIGTNTPNFVPSRWGPPIDLLKRDCANFGGFGAPWFLWRFSWEIESHWRPLSFTAKSPPLFIAKSQGKSVENSTIFSGEFLGDFSFVPMCSTIKKSWNRAKSRMSFRISYLAGSAISNTIVAVHRNSRTTNHELWIASAVPVLVAHRSAGVTHQSQIDPRPRYFWKVSRYTSHFYRDTFARVSPSLGRK